MLGEESWLIFWPLNGVSIALLLMRPRREWPLFLLTTTLSAGFGEFLSGTPVSLVGVQGFSVMLEITLAALLLPPFTDLETWLSEQRLYPRFSVAVLLGPLLTVTLEAAALRGILGKTFCLCCWILRQARSSV